MLNGSQFPSHSSWLSMSVGISQDISRWPRRIQTHRVLPGNWPSAVRLCIKFGSGEALALNGTFVFCFGGADVKSEEHVSGASHSSGGPSLRKVHRMRKSFERNLRALAFILIIVIFRFTLCAVLISEHYICICIGVCVSVSVSVWASLSGCLSINLNALRSYSKLWLFNRWKFAWAYAGQARPGSCSYFSRSVRLRSLPGPSARSTPRPITPSPDLSGSAQRKTQLQVLWMS